ncbi:putative membrane protein [Lewinella aquimaris]|uniref:Putative membrane protein n=1 Tax=Neolewinella aquimaris TaxID=1835722 RepID=A0A840E9U2_9BACT|nr:DUF202 domain-containing protein [Neolewinella aquimaris]MBB4080127.1 putative membrane protein [Neolewinella aquimaris]
MLTETDLGLTDRLALDRTHLANQRTLLAYTRTGIYFAFTGAGVLFILQQPAVNWIGWLAIAIGIVIATIGLINYLRMKRRIGRLYQ